ncbi:hypothetical protein BOC39_28985 [Burkholderia pseudomallei]|nr:hypothetical protein BOC39_28985 [Burkholderia pseudomallei]RPE15875.1 hypothetical protein DF127_22045 [Burkholderia pseudomallei]RQS89727.1 hypothetical protein DF125_20745 [Burkholderia pseudomallei]
MVGGRWSVVGGRWSVVGGRWSVVGGRWSVVGGRWSAIFAGAPRNALRPQAVDTGPVSTDRRKLPPQHKRLAATLPIHARIASMPIAASRPLSPSRRFDAHVIATVNEKVERRMAEAHGRHARAAYDVPMLCRPLRAPRSDAAAVQRVCCAGGIERRPRPPQP